MQLNHMSSPVALCRVTTKTVLTFEWNKHTVLHSRENATDFINHQDKQIPSSVTILFYSRLTLFCNYENKQNPKDLSAFYTLSLFVLPPFSLGNRVLLQKLRLAPLATCEVGFYSMGGGDLFRNLWGPEMKQCDHLR